MENKESLARRIGSKIKEIRKQAGLTLKQLADASELTPGTLSKIENGLTKPSITTLEMLADSLRVDIGYLFKDEEEKGYVISRPSERRFVVSERGPERRVAYELELLADRMEDPFMEPALITLRGKEQDEEIELATHDGQEFMYVLEGRMELTLGRKKYILKKGDAGYWNGSIPHKGISLSKKQARTLNVHLVPGKRTGTFQIKD